MAPSNKSNADSVPGWFVALVLVVFGIFIWYKANNPPSPDKKTTKEYVVDEFDALVACQNHVSHRLKSPSSAKFPVMREINVLKTAPNEWLFEAYVDANNGFGAHIRSRYECKAQYNNQKFTIISFEFIN